MKTLRTIVRDLEKSKNNPLESMKVLAFLQEEVDRLKKETAKKIK